MAIAAHVDNNMHVMSGTTICHEASVRTLVGITTMQGGRSYQDSPWLPANHLLRLPWAHLPGRLPEVDDVFSGVGKQLLAEALEVAVDQRQRAAGGVAQRELPGQEAALYRRKLALAQVQVVLALPQVPPGSEQ